MCCSPLVVITGLDAVKLMVCRDIKPDNMLLNMDGPHNSPHLRLIDFGSALDGFAIHNLYGSEGPSVQQQTPEYAPPEALLSRLADMLNLTCGNCWSINQHE